MKFQGILLLFFGLCCCSNVQQAKAFQFRLTQKVPPASNNKNGRRQGGQQQQQQQQQPQHVPDVAFGQSGVSSSRLNAFGGGGFGDFNPNPPNPPIRNRQDVLERLQAMALRTWQQFTSGLISGYILGSLWGLLRGPSLSVSNRGVAWGLDFGILSALFSTTESVTQFILALQPATKEKTNHNGDNNADIDIKRQKKAMLWSVTIRNIMLAIYFGRHGGIVKMMRSALLYGGLTYYFVSQKNKRDVVRFKSMNSNSVMMGNDPSSAMQQILQQMLANQASSTSTATSAKTTGTTPTSKSPPKKPSNNAKPRAASINAVDVEWEKVEKDDNEDRPGADDTKGEDGGNNNR